MKIKIENVTKIYRGNIVGVRDVDLDIQSGMFGILGPNGAGKTTLIRMIATLLKPTYGDIFINNESVVENPQSIRSILGYLPQDFGVYSNLKAWEFLDYFALLEGIEDFRERESVVGKSLEIVGLSDYANRFLRTYSGGMIQRIGIAQTLLRPRKLLLVDEPTAGLDPEERIKFRNLLSEISIDKLVILTTHIVSDVEATCEELTILKEGRVLTHATTNDIIAQVQGKVWEITTTLDQLENLKRNYRLISIVRKAGSVSLRLISTKKPGDDYMLCSPNLEDAYIYLIGESEGAGDE